MMAKSRKVVGAHQELIKLIQNDYAHIRQELLNMSSGLRDREMRVSRLVGAALAGLDQTGEGHDRTFDKYSGSTHSGRTHGAISALSPVAEEIYRPSLEVHCLGKFRVLVDSKEIVHWRSLKARSLLKCLLENDGHSASRDMLMEALWPGCEASTANNNLKVAVLALRRTLEFGQGENGALQVVIFGDGNYSINPRVALYVDAEQFEYHWHAGKNLERKGKFDEAITEYDAASALYEGDFLQDDVYEDWTLIKRETLKDKYLAILGKLAEHSMRKADYEGAVDYCERILGKDCCREDVYCRLITCYSRMGQRNRAVEWYRLCEKTLRRELDVGPDQGLVALYEKLFRGEHI